VSVHLRFQKNTGEIHFELRTKIPGMNIVELRTKIPGMNIATFQQKSACGSGSCK
jgi:hypothetical protein